MPVPSPETVAAVLQRVDAELDRSRENLFALLRIPSVSAQPAHKSDCVRAAEWCRDQLAGLGFNADLRPTPPPFAVRPPQASEAGSTFAPQTIRQTVSPLRGV